MKLITKKQFIDAVGKAKEVYFIACVHHEEYSLERLKGIIDNATYQQLTVDKRRVMKINNHQLVTRNGDGELNYVNFKPFEKYYNDEKIFYITGDVATLVYLIKAE